MAIRVAYLTCEVPGRLDSVRGLKQPRLVPHGGAMSTQTMEPRLELEQHLHMYRQMAKIRAFDEQVNELYKSAKMPGLAHLYIGEEGVAVGVCEALRRDDFITSTHRGHGHCLAKGAAVDRMFGKLPVIYVCENNLYGEYTPGTDTIAGEIVARPRALGVHAETVDGQDVQAVHATMRRFVERARRGEGPAFLECKTYRYYGHHVGDVNREYRTREEEQEWMSHHDPLETLTSRLTAQGLADAGVFERILTDVKAEIDGGVQYALAAPYPEASEVDEDVYA